MFGRKKRDPKPGVIDRQPSCIMAVPASARAVGGPQEMVARLKAAEDFRLLSFQEDGEGGLTVRIGYRGSECSVELRAAPAELPELFTANHHFTEEGIAAMRSAAAGILSRMIFPAGVLEGYHLQLKILDCVTPGMAGLIDYCSEHILSGLWVRMAAASRTPPAPSYLYTIQAVGGETEVWLHTHGLNRCGSIELEILAAGREHYQQEASVIQTLAGNIVTRGELEAEYEPIWIGRLTEDALLVGTWIGWETAVDTVYKKLELGGRGDRREGHNADTGVLMCYPSPEDCDKRKPVPLSAYDALLEENPLLMITSEETERMSALAAERFDYFRRGLGLPGATGMVKMGMPVDEAYREEDGANLEHLWFEAQRVDGETIHCRLTQDAYYIGELREGKACALPLSRLTDWVLYLPEAPVTPDSVYRMEQGMPGPAADEG